MRLVPRRLGWVRPCGHADRGRQLGFERVASYPTYKLTYCTVDVAPPGTARPVLQRHRDLVAVPGVGGVVAAEPVAVVGHQRRDQAGTVAAARVDLAAAWPAFVLAA